MNATSVFLLVAIVVVAVAPANGETPAIEAKQSHAIAGSDSIPPAKPITDLSLLHDRVASAISAAKTYDDPPVPEFKDAANARGFMRWRSEMSKRLKPAIPDERQRLSFLDAVWYESRRAGLDVSLVLALIERLSAFNRKFYGPKGAIGYLGVHAAWTRRIGDGDDYKLYHVETNLRYGTSIIRHLLDDNKGDLYYTIGQYLADSWQVPANDLSVFRGIEEVFAIQRKWVYLDASK
ncbi:MAG: lytic transglycosylase domain-containing protein [Proteobacteria bacterium]|nr:lytic transglycosylase domain-containing protein [Pseudomonadota bacterium]